MGRVTSNIGLVTGVPITQTVDQLIALQARPRDLIVARNKKLSGQQVAVTEISALLLAFEFTTNNLGKASVFEARSVSSSAPTLLAATSSGQPPLGSFQFTPLATVQSQQLLSSGVASGTSPVGAGKVSFRFGGFIDEDTNLDLANAGAGFKRGKIRLTDRSGASAEIDLRFARTADDVLRAINDNPTINIRAQTQGDRLRLVDQTGQSLANLRVQEVGSGTTAASLGLAGIDVAANQADGQDIVRLFNQLDLNKLNDGGGVRFNKALADLQVSFRDGSTPLAIDFRRLAVVGTQARGTTSASGGADSQVTITAKTAGSAFNGVSVVFENDDALTAGNETVSYNSGTKTLTFKIDEGNTTASQAIAAVGRNAAVAALFTASKPAAATGSGLVAVTDSATLTGPSASATTPGVQGANAKVQFTAVQGGAAFDGVSISFVDNAAVAAGSETVVYDDSNPNDKKLTFQIDAGNTTANQILTALNNDPLASQKFTAALTSGSTGAGIVDVSDTTVTAGGAILEPQTAGTEATLGDVLATLNAAAPTRLKAELSADGDRIVLSDLTSGGGSFSLTALNGSKALDDLGLAAAPAGGVVTGRRLLGGLKNSLLASLAGGAGPGTLGGLALTDRSGASATVNLAGIETVQGVVDAINSAGLGIVAGLNPARNGILLSDTTGGSGNLIVANADATNSADKLQIANNAAVASKNSGNLRRRVVSENTRLSSLNGGAGVAKGTFNLQDTEGHNGTVNIDINGIETVGDVIDEINRQTLGIKARINDAGDGILLFDTLGGPGALRVTEGNRSTAADLHLLGGEKTIDVGGTPTKVIDGSTTLSIELAATDTLSTLVDKINALNGGARAGIFNDGSSVNPLRLTLLSQRAGSVGQLLVDGSQSTFSFEETAKAQDALLLFGSGEGGGSGILATSSSNTFRDILPGVTLNVLGTSTTAVTVSVSGTDSSLVGGVQAAVENYNRLRKKLLQYTAFDAEQNKAGELLGDATALRVDAELSSLFSGRFNGAGSIRSLEVLGLSLKDDGTLELDSEQLKTQFAANPAAVQEFFTKEKSGFSAKFKSAIEGLANEDSSLLANRLRALANKVDDNNNKVTFLTARLDKARERLLAQYVRMEIAISQIQANTGALSSLSQLAASVRGGTSTR